MHGWMDGWSSKPNQTEPSHRIAVYFFHRFSLSVMTWLRNKGKAKLWIVKMEKMNGFVFLMFVGFLDEPPHHHPPQQALFYYWHHYLTRGRKNAYNHPFFFFLHLHPLFLIVAFTVIIITVLPLPLQKAIVNQSTWVRESVRGFFGMNSVELNICSAVGLSLSERVKLSNAKRAKSSELFPFFFNKFVKKGKKCKRIWEEEEVKKCIQKSYFDGLLVHWLCWVYGPYKM